MQTVEKMTAKQLMLYYKELTIKLMRVYMDLRAYSHNADLKGIKRKIFMAECLMDTWRKVCLERGEVI